MMVQNLLVYINWNESEKTTPMTSPSSTDTYICPLRDVKYSCCSPSNSMNMRTHSFHIAYRIRAYRRKICLPNYVTWISVTTPIDKTWKNLAIILEQWTMISIFILIYFKHWEISHEGLACLRAHAQIHCHLIVLLMCNKSEFTLLTIIWVSKAIACRWICMAVTLHAYI